MKLTVLLCRTDCRRVSVIGTYEKDFKHGDLNGVYVCPICKGKNVQTLLRPFEADVKIKIIGGNVADNTRIATALAQFARQGEVTTRVEQLRSPGRRDNEPGEGTPEKFEEPIVDGELVPRTVSPCSEYELEVSKYLGVSPEDAIYMPQGE